MHGKKLKATQQFCEYLVDMLDLKKTLISEYVLLKWAL